MIAYTALAAWRNDEALIGVQLQTEQTTKVLQRLDTTTNAQAKSNAVVSGTMTELTTATSALHSQLRSFVEWQSSANSDRLKLLEQQYFHAQEALREMTDENAKLRAENVGLRQTLTRKLVDAELQFDAMRKNVSVQLEQERVDFDSFRRSVFQRIDAAVLQYHRPQFESAVESLRGHLSDVQRSVDEHTARLVLIAESIGSTGVVPEVKSMHSQLPERLRAQLRHFTKESLLSLVDILSFEAGVTSAVASAVAASNVHETQNVFS